MSPRPRKHRRCSCPFRGHDDLVFKPAGIPLKDLQIIHIPHDEIEAVHLCDGEQMSQEEAGSRMGVSRGTVQRLVTAGRKKIVDALLNGKAIVVSPMGKE